MKKKLKYEDWFKSKPIKVFGKQNKKKTKLEDEFSPEKALKTVGGLAVLGVGVHLATELID